MTDLDKMAMELLAAECAKNGISAEYIDKVLSGNVGDGGQEGYEITIAAINAALRTAPEGFVLVPIKMTDTMRDAGNMYVKDRGALVSAYAAMLATAQK